MTPLMKMFGDARKINVHCSVTLRPKQIQYSFPEVNFQVPLGLKLFGYPHIHCRENGREMIEKTTIAFKSSRLGILRQSITLTCGGINTQAQLTKVDGVHAGMYRQVKSYS